MWQQVAELTEFTWDEAEAMHWKIVCEKGKRKDQPKSQLAMVYDRFVLPPPVLVERGWCLGV